MILVWDEPKRLANLAKHGLDFADVERQFDWTSALVVTTRRGRFKAVGNLSSLAVTLVFATLGAEALAFISLRRASKRERLALHGGNR